MNIESLKKMRDPFPENQINYLPKPTKKREEMDKLPKAICSVCGGYHATKNIIHLAYVGHAALTDRLLEVDPSWTWEPLAIDQSGLPVIDKDGGLWIKLTVCGITRLGYGDAQGKTGGDAMKERIGDALRNAAMRFGAALDLWHKGDLKPGENPDVVTHGSEDNNNHHEQPGKSGKIEPTQKAVLINNEQLNAMRDIINSIEGYSEQAFCAEARIQSLEMLPASRFKGAFNHVQSKATVTE